MKVMIRKINCLIVILLLALSAGGQQNFGLRFNAFNVPQENRTSLAIGAKAPLCFERRDAVTLSFDLSLVPNQHTYFGYVLRIVNNSGQHINLIYDQAHKLFRLTANGSYTGINFSIPDNALFRQWTNIKLLLTDNHLSLFINGQYFSKVSISLADFCFRITYGAGNDGNFSTTDVPPMALRNIKIAVGQNDKYDWPLRFADSSGIVYDSIGHCPAVAVNPVWASGLHNRWQFISSGIYKGNASIAFDENREQLYIVAEDSVYRISFSGDTTGAEVFPSSNYHLFSGNRSVFNSVDGKLYNYYTDIGSVAEYSFEKGTWDKRYDTVNHTGYSQADRLFVPGENALYIFGGYGFLKYKNLVQRYTFSAKQWDTLQVGGDYFTPRYLAAGARAGDSIYILGGYGSRTGDQMLNPDYIYDLMRYDIRNRTFKKIYTLNKPDSSIVFGSSMVIDSAHQCYYAFCFSNERSDSRLQLIRGSLNKPQYELLADPIPYRFHDILSGADLFYCPLSEKLLAVTFISMLDREVKVNIYSIAFPPDVFTADTAYGPAKNVWKYWIYACAAVLLLCALAVFFFRKRPVPVAAVPKDQPLDAQRPVIPAPAYSEEFMEAAQTKSKERQLIHLFGTFEMLDKNGEGLSENLSPLLKELFLVILLHSLDNKTGVSSERLNEMFWHDKPEKDANNNRSVNIAKLKNILEKLGNITIRKSSGKWKMEYEPSEITIDLVDFLNAASGSYEDAREKAAKMLSVLGRGSFLSQTEYDWLDDIKSEVSNKVIDELLHTSRALDPVKDADIMVRVANAIFYFDPVNEDAIRLKCKSLALIGRHSLAKSSYEHFSKEYQKMYGETFAVPFNEIITL